jgi:hypothetical protein
MDSDGGYRGRRVRLPGYDAAEAAGSAEARSDGIRHVRRLSNWTAAALLVGTGAAAAALAHQAIPAAGPVAQASATGTSPGAASQAETSGPQVSHSVATTTASGVTVTTTTRTINGQAVVTQVRSAPATGDN